MQQINLLDPSLLAAPRLLGSGALVGLVGAAALAVAGHWALESHWTRSALAAVVPPAPPAETAIAADAAASAADPAQALQARIAEREALRAVLVQQTQLPRAPAELIAQVIAALPQNMWLSEIDIAGTRNLRIAGGTLDPAALSTFAQALGGITALRGVPIESVRLEGAAVLASDPDSEGLPPSHRFLLASTASTTAAAATAPAAGGAATR